jgi:hypothetical protein
MADAKVIISAENKLKQGLNDAQKDLQNFESSSQNIANSFGEIGNKIKSALTFTGIAVAFEQIGKAAIGAYTEFGEFERRLKTLKIALNDNESSFNQATKLINDMSKMSLASKDEIAGLVAELAALGKSDADIDKITKAAVNLSNVTGKDLNNAFQLINGTYAGTVGRLDRLIPEIKSLSKEQLEAGGAVDLINGKFGDLSEQLAENNIPQKLKNLKDQLSDLKQAVGESIAPILTPIISEFTTFIEQTVIPKVKDVGKVLGNVFRDLPGMGKLAFDAVLDIIKTAFSWATIGDILSNLGKYIAETVSTAFAVIPHVFVNLLKLLIDPLVSFGKFIGEVVSKAIQGKWKEIPSPGDLFADILKQQVGTIGTIATDAGNLYMDQLKRAFYLDTTIGKNILEVPLEKFYKNFDTLFGVHAETSPAGGSTPRATGGNAIDVLTDDEKKNQKTLEELLKSIVSFVDITENHPEYYSYDKIVSTLKDFQGNIYKAETFKLGPEGQALLNDIRTVFQSLEAKYGLNNKPIILLSPAESARSQAMNMLGIRSTTQPLLTAVPTLQRIETGLPTPPQWQPPMTQQEEAMGLAMNELGARYFANQSALDMAKGLVMNEKGAQYFIDQFNKKLLNPLDSFARHYIEAARQALTLTGGTVYGESGIVPSKLGAGGASVKDQIAAMQGGEGFFAWLKNSFDGTIQGLGISISDTFKSIKDTGLSGGDILSGISDAFGGLISAVQPLTQIIFSANPLFAALIPIVQAMVQTLQPVIFSLLAPLMGILAIIGKTLGAVLAPVLKILSPIIELVGKAFVWLYNNVIMPIANALIWVFTAVQNAIAGVINAFTWLTGISVQYASYEDAKLQKIEYGDVVQAGANAAGATAAQSAQYRSQSITINIYQQSPVVGDNGMRQFAAMIRAEFEALAYYGT